MFQQVDCTYYVYMLFLTLVLAADVTPSALSCCRRVVCALLWCVRPVSVCVCLCRGLCVGRCWSSAAQTHVCLLGLCLFFLLKFVRASIAEGETQFECVRLIVSVVIVGLKQSMWNIALLSSNLAVQYPNLVRPSWIVVSRVASTQPIRLGQSS